MGRILRNAILVVFVFTGFKASSQTHIVINEVYGGGGNSGATHKNDFIELYNPTGLTVDLAGWSVQYASVTGSSWAVTNLSGSIAPGDYYLVQEASGAGNGVSLPTPDAAGTLALSATNGKVALVNSTTALSGTCPTSASIIDLIGFGPTANCFEGAATPVITNATSMQRKIVGVDSDNNAADFQAGTPSPRGAIVQFTSAYPKIQSPVSQGFQAASNLNKSTSITYLIVLASGAAAPTSDQVKNGQDATGTGLASNLKATITNTTGGTTYTYDVSGLSPLTSYDVYFVSENSANLQAAPVKVSATTTAVSPPIMYPSGNSITFSGYTAHSNQSGSQSYTLTASDLTDDITISVTGNYLISKDNNSFQSTISFVSTDFNASASQTVYVKFNPNGSVGTLTGTITHTTTGGSDKLVTLSAVSIDPFNQNFNDPSFLTSSGWTQYSVTGAQVWASTNFGHTCLTACTTTTVDKAAQINGFATTAQENVDWLISPALDLSGFLNFPALSFWTISAFDGPGLQLKYSTDYAGSGDPTGATWTTLDGKFPAPNSSSWTKSSNIILPKSSIYVALVYTSSTAAASRWTFDDWKLEDVSSYMDVPFIQFGFGQVAAGSYSDSKNFAFTSQGYGDITVTAPEGYEVSIDNTTFSTSQPISEADALSGKTVYVRFSPAAKKIKWDGTLSFKGTGLDVSYGSLTGSSFPKSETFNITAYNLEFFGADVVGTGGEFGPADDPLQISNMTTVLQTIGADIFGVEEIANDEAFATLVSNLPGYDKIVSDKWSYSFNVPDANFPPQKIGFIYKTSTVQVVSSRVMFAKLYDDIRAASSNSAALLLLPGYPTTGGNTPSNFWSSGRLPFMVTFDVTINGTKKRIRVIDIHAKSGSAQADYDRRKYDAQVLRDSLVANYAHDKIILLGDFNDDVNGSINTGSPSSYKMFVDDAENFNVLTFPLSQAGAYSFPSSSSFLDHIIVSNELSSDYVSNSMSVEDPRTYVSGYTTTTSDHLPVTARFALSKSSQTITFNTLPRKTASDAAFDLTATSTSGLAVSYASSDPTIASISGKTVTLKKAGTVTITASQPGDNSYLAAVDVMQSLVVGKGSQIIIFNSVPTKTVGDAAFTLSATSTSSLAVNFGTASDKVMVSGSQLTIVTAGSVTITASQAGNENYIAATSVNQTFCINPAKPTITLSNVNSESPTLTSSASTGNQWYLNGAVIAGATNATFSATAAGIYKVQVKADNCLSVFSNDTPLIVTGDIKNVVEVITVYPNPVEDYLMISGLSGETMECLITDMTGRTSTLKLERQQRMHRADVQYYGAGLYVARIKSGNSVQQIKFIKK